MAESRVLIIDANEERAQQVEVLLRFMDCVPVRVDDIALTMGGRHHPSDWLAIVLGETKEQEALDQFVAWLRKDPLHPAVLALPEHHESGAQRFGLGSHVFWPLEYPARYSQLSELLRRASVARMDQEASATVLMSGPTGSSPATLRLRKMIEQVAGFDTTVLVLGESGTGKEVVARAIHERSSRKNKPFIAINCGAIPSDLLESELFGHEKGAFTGAISSRKGRFEMAEGGTLFLDEIGDMSLPMQVKILRVLQERSFERVGSNQTLRCDVRIIAATHRNLEENIVKGTFREDLYYRLNVFPIEMPSLRERIEDLPELIESLTMQLEKSGRGSVRFTSDAVAVLRQYVWKGNVRELSNLVERMAVLHPGGIVRAVDLPMRYRGESGGDIASAVVIPLNILAQASSPDVGMIGHGAVNNVFDLPLSKDAPLLDEAALPAEGIDLKEHMARIEISLIRHALARADGVVAHAAQILGLRRTTLVEKLRKYQLTRDGSDLDIASEV